MKTHVTDIEILDEYHAGGTWSALGAKRDNLERVAGVDGGMSITELLTANSLGASRVEMIWMVNRYVILGPNLFDLLSRSIARISGTRSSDTLAAIDVLSPAVGGVVPKRDELAQLRLDAKNPFPDGFKPVTDAQDNSLAFAAHQAILALEEVQRGRLHRNAHYSMATVLAMANRPGVLDPEIEYQWVIDEVLSYYAR